MPAIFDRGAIRRILNTDRIWSTYALGDLGPEHFEHCSWHASRDRQPALVLLYKRFAPPVLFGIGDPQSIAPLLDEVGAEPRFGLHVRPEILPVIAARREIVHSAHMLRMFLAPGEFRASPYSGAVRLGPADLECIERLFRDGDAAGEAPDFFFPPMLERGVFFGIRDEVELVSVAGTHLVVREEGVAAVGNVYTRRDRRGHGLAPAVTSAVVNELLRLGIDTIILNVKQENQPARRLYERLGFRVHCSFFEGLAVL